MASIGGRLTVTNSNQVKRLLVQSVLLPAGMLVLFAVLLIVQLSGLSAANQSEKLFQASLDQIGNVRESFVDAESSFRGYLVDPSAQTLALYRKTSVRLPASIDSLSMTIAPPSADRSLVASLKGLSREWLAFAQNVMTIRNRHGNVQTQKIRAHGRALGDEFRGLTERLIESQRQGYESVHQARSTRQGWVLKLGILMVLIALSWIVYFSARRLRSLVGTYRDLARGAQDSAMAYRESERRYKKIIEGAEEGIWILDAELRTTLVNAKLAKNLGYTVEEMIGAPYFDFIDNDMLETAKEQVRRRRSGVSDHYDFRFRRKDGTSAWAIVAAHPIYHEKTGAFAGSVAMVTDITARKRQELEREFLSETSAILATSLNYQETLKRIVQLAVQRFGGWCAIHTAGDGPFLKLVALAHADPEKEAVGERLARLFPLSTTAAAGPAHVITSQKSELISEVSEECLGAFSSSPEQLEAIRLQFPKSFLCVPLVARNQTFGAMSFLSTEHNYGPDCVSLAEELGRRFALAVDNSRLYEAEQQSRQKAEETLALLETALNSSPAGLAFMDRDLTLLKINRAFVSLTLADENLARAGCDAQRAFADLPVNVIHAFRDVIMTGAPVLDREVRIEARWSPDVRHVLLSCYPVISSAGNTIGVGVVAFDITQRKAAEDSLQTALRSRDEFLSVASHELKTPLTALFLKLQLLGHSHEKSAGFSDQQTQTMIRDCEIQSRRLARLIDQLLDLTRIRSRKLELKMDEVNLLALTEEVAKSFESELGQAGSRISVHCEAPLTGFWDRMRLEQVVTNLLSNAIKYGLGHPIEVLLEAKDAYARLIVRDHGIGIPIGEQSKIFDKFERASPSRQIGGLGLGLYIVRQIVAAHGGTISVQSKPGEGSAFIVELPKQGGRPGLTQATEASQDQGTVLES